MEGERMTINLAIHTLEMIRDAFGMEHMDTEAEALKMAIERLERDKSDQDDN